MCHLQIEHDLGFSIGVSNFDGPYFGNKSKMGLKTTTYLSKDFKQTASRFLQKLKNSSSV